MSRCIVLACGLFSLILFQTGCSENHSEAGPEGFHVETAINDFAVSFLADDRIHSLSIAIHDRGAEYSLHYGEQNPGKGNPPTDSTLYELASVTKTFTGTMAAKAILENKIELNDDIRNYLDGPYPNLAFKSQPITIRDILTHTGGFPNFPPTMENKAAFLAGLQKIEIDTEPGTRFSYSNTAPEITAYLLEQVYNTPYQELIRQQIFEPNGMSQTRFNLTDPERRFLIDGYNDVGVLQNHYQNKLWGGIAGIHSTTTDLLKYIKYQLDESNAVVKESHRNLFNTRYDFDIGYHWNISKIDNKIYYRHHGGIWGMQNWLMIYPSDQIGIAVLSNASFEGIDDALEKLALIIYRHLVATH